MLPFAISPPARALTILPALFNPPPLMKLTLSLRFTVALLFGGTALAQAQTDSAGTVRIKTLGSRAAEISAASESGRSV